MARTARASVANDCYHCLNRGDAHAVFHKDAGYQAFVDLIADACRRRPLRALAFCLMPNHIYLIPTENVGPEADGQVALSRGVGTNDATFGYPRRGRRKKMRDENGLGRVIRVRERVRLAER